jgi:hypothetical protein
MNIYLLSHELVGPQLWLPNVFSLLFACGIAFVWYEYLWAEESDYEAKKLYSFVVTVTLIGLAVGFLHPQATLIFGGLGLTIAAGAVGFNLRKYTQRVKGRLRSVKQEITRIQNEQRLLAQRTSGNIIVPDESQFNWRWRLKYLLTTPLD